jgi:hypothetical protein
MENFKPIVCCLIVTLLISVQVCSQQGDLASAHNIVKIKTTYKNKSGQLVNGTATGWCWDNSMYIVTALHVVAGIKDIEVFNQSQKKGQATIVKVLLEADLALLKLNVDLGLKPLSVKNVDPNSKTEFTIWGYPHGIFTIAGDDVRFSRSLNQNPTLNDIITQTDLKFDLVKQGFPLPNARIYRVSSIIQPGHSGAPILTSDGIVIGIGDGGLRDGTARINWAMPAAYYMPKLLISTDAIPNNISVQASLYTSTTLVKDNATSDDQVQELEQEAKNDVVVNGSETINKTWTAGFEDITGTLEPTAKKEIDDFMKEYNIPTENMYFDVYEDFENGATVVLPAGQEFTNENTWYCVINQDKTLEYYTAPYGAKSYEDAIKEIEALLDGFGEDWTIDNDEPDNVEADNENQTASYDGQRFSKENPDKKLFFSAEVEDSNIVIAILICYASKLNDEEYLTQFSHFMISAELSSFSKN